MTLPSWLPGLLLAWVAAAPCARAFVTPWPPSTRAQGLSVGPSFVRKHVHAGAHHRPVSPLPPPRSRTHGPRPKHTGEGQPGPHHTHGPRHLLQPQQHGPRLSIYGSRSLRRATDGEPEEQGARRRGRLPPSAYQVPVGFPTCQCGYVDAHGSGPFACAKAGSHDDRGLFFLCTPLRRDKARQAPQGDAEGGVWASSCWSHLPNMCPACLTYVSPPPCINEFACHLTLAAYTHTRTHARTHRRGCRIAWWNRWSLRSLAVRCAAVS
jgi:hypothetical protein